MLEEINAYNSTLKLFYYSSYLPSTGIHFHDMRLSYTVSMATTVTRDLGSYIAVKNKNSLHSIREL